MSLLKVLERSGKHLVIKVLRLLLPGPGKPPGRGLKDARIDKILIIRLEKKLGNLVMTTFFPRALRDLYPDADIDILVNTKLREIWDNNPFVNRIVTFDHSVHLRNPLRLVTLLMSLRKAQYDAVIDCSNPGGFSLSNGMVTRVTGAPYRIGFDRGDSGRFMNITVAPDHTKHYIGMMHDLLALFSSEKVHDQPEIFLTPQDIEAAERELAARCKITGTRLVFIWVGARENKQWPLEHFKVLAGQLRLETGTTVRYLCGPAEKRFYKLLSSEDTESVLYVDDFTKLAALIKASALFVAGDVGPMHLAAALDVKTVAVFLHNNYTVYGYEDGIRHRVVDLSHDSADIDTVVKVCRETLAA